VPRGIVRNICRLYEYCRNQSQPPCKLACIVAEGAEGRWVSAFGNSRAPKRIGAVENVYRLCPCQGPRKESFAMGRGALIGSE